MSVAIPKILLIDDNEQDQKIIMRFLVKVGLTNLYFAPNGEAGLKQAEGLRPDLVLCDTMMPGIDGFETCRRLKQDLKLSAKFIIMAGRVSAVDAEKARQMGADDYCVKTADCQSVLVAVGKIYPQAAIVKEEAPHQQSALVTNSVEVTPPAEKPIWGREKTEEAIRLLSQELERKNEELKELDKLKSAFISNVSHELRTPLTIIDGAVSQILSGLYGPVNAEQQDKLKMTLRNSERLRLLIEDLLDIARLEAKKVKLNLESVNMVELVREMHEAFSVAARERAVELKMSCPATTMNAFVDKNRIIQVLTNLLGNALKFTEQGWIEVSLQDDPDCIACCVADSGGGIAPENLGKVFERFQQFGEETGSKYKGTGLGLAISKEIIDLHGGKIWVKSVLDKGSQFFFTVPKSKR